MTKMELEKVPEKFLDLLEKLPHEKALEILTECMKEKLDLKKGDSIVSNGIEYFISKDLLSDVKAMLIPAKGIIYVPFRTESDQDIAELFPHDNLEKTLTITQMANITGLSRNTVYRVCKYLVFHGFLKRNEDFSYQITGEALCTDYGF